MTKALDNLFYGNLDLSGQPMPKGSAMHKAGEQPCKCEDALEALLNQEGRGKLKVLSNVQLELEPIIAEENFIIGFRLGVQVTADSRADVERLPIRKRYPQGAPHPPPGAGQGGWWLAIPRPTPA